MKINFRDNLNNYWDSHCYQWIGLTFRTIVVLWCFMPYLGIPRVRIVTLEDTKVIATIYWPWKREVAKAFVSAVNNQLDAKEVNDNH